MVAVMCLANICSWTVSSVSHYYLLPKPKKTFSMTVIPEAFLTISDESDDLLTNFLWNASFLLTNIRYITFLLLFVWLVSNYFFAQMSVTAHRSHSKMFVKGVILLLDLFLRIMRMNDLKLTGKMKNVSRALKNTSEDLFLY